MTSRITEFDPPLRFVDEMVRGPFRSFRHEHRFEARGDGTRMTDVIRFRMGPWLLGRIADPFVLAYLRRLMTIRNSAISTAAGHTAAE